MACTLGLVAIVMAAQPEAPPVRSVRTLPSSSAHSPMAPTRHASPTTPTSSRQTLPTPTGNDRLSSMHAASVPRSKPQSPSAALSATADSAVPSTPQGFGPASLTPAAATAVPPVTFTGWLAGPDSISATYAFDGGTGRPVTATWSGGTNLDLAVTCGGSIATHAGPSPITIHASGGTCSVTLSGPSDVSTSTFEIVEQP